MPVAILRGDARHLPLPDGSVDLVMTSPPYFGLRSYTDGGEHYDGQLGSEATPAEFVAALVECVAEMVRVLKPEGSIFLNLGDKYDARPGAGPNAAARGAGRNVQASRCAGNPKSLLGLPWRVALACTDQLGLILRAEIIWNKPNSLPESVTDRVRRSHEQIFHFTRQPRYYAAVDEIREPHTGTAHSPGTPRMAKAYLDRQNNGGGNAGNTVGENPLGKLPGSVWTIPSAPLTVPASLGVDHFAAFPPGLVRPVVLGWSPPGICVACGQGRRPTVEGAGPATVPSGRKANPTASRGYACACPTPDAPTRPAVVLDPFGGTGTTALVAAVHGRIGVTVDRSADYSRLAAWRCHDPGERARALDVDRPPPVMDGQGELELGLVL